MELPKIVTMVLERLESNGFEAVLVGGCVRDKLLGKDPTDYDIATSATPDEIKMVFHRERMIDVGIQHGTVTLIYPEMCLEVTTYRLDGEYIDARHPIGVSFTRNLEEDLKRRDFTINAMAYSPKNGLVDLFGGQDDLKHGVIRCVGDPEKRFDEDALRIMRALRFSSTLGFSIDEKTAQAGHKLCRNLQQIAKERVTEEFMKLICGKNARAVLLDMIDVIGVFIPQALAMKGFSQQNPHHIYTVLEHSVVTMEQVSPKPYLRLAAFLHDIGKPSCFTMDENGIGHFHGHTKASIRISENILDSLRFDNSTKERVIQLVRWHDYWIEPNKKSIKRMLNRLTPELFFDLLELKRGDNLAQHPDYWDRVEIYETISTLARTILEEKECFTVKDLAVNGNDLIKLGIAPGKAIGELLSALLEGVVDEQYPNEKKALLHQAKKQLTKK